MQLQEVHLKRCTWLRSWMCLRLFMGCPQLQVVDLSFVPSLSDGDVTMIAKSCPQLKRVNLRECCNLGDAAVMALTMHCTGLVFLDLSRTDQKYKVRFGCSLFVRIVQFVPKVRSLLEYCSTFIAGAMFCM